jgi:hypothetical protein
MNIDFNGLRRNLAESYNRLVGALTTSEQREIAVDLCGEIAGLLAIYDGGEIRDLSYEITLADPFEEVEAASEKVRNCEVKSDH